MRIALSYELVNKAFRFRFQFGFHRLRARENKIVGVTAEQVPSISK